MRCLLLCAVVLVAAACGDNETIIDDDAGVSPSIDVPLSLTLVEGESTMFVVELVDPPDRAVTIQLASADDATATVSPLYVVLSAATPSATVTATGSEDDADIIDDETQLVVAIEGAEPRHITTRVVDNDVQQIVLDTTTLSVTEGGTATFAVRLTREPAEPMTVAVWSDASAIAAVTPASLTFGPGDYTVPQTVTVTGVTDADTASASAHVYVGQLPNVTNARVDVGVIDDDVQALVLGATTVPVTEGGSATFTVALAYDPIAPVIVNLLSSDPTAASVTSLPGLQFTTANYNVPQTVTVHAPEDNDQLNEPSVTIALSGAVTGSVATPVTDNDDLIVNAQAGTVFEGRNTSFTVRLANDPGTAGRTVAIDVTSGNMIVSPSTLSFTSANYASGLTVTVTGGIDAYSTSDQTAQIRVSSPGQTPRELSYTVYDKIPGQFFPLSFGPSNRYTGALTNLQVSFTPENDWPGDGKLDVAFPPGFDVSAATAISATIDGTLSVSATTSTLTVARSGGSVAPAGASVTVILGNVRNPPFTDPGPISAATKTAAGDPIDSGATSVLWFVAAPMPNASVTLANHQPGGTGTATIDFVTTNPWPADGSLSVTFPTGFNIAGATAAGFTGIDGTLTPAGTGNFIVLTRAGGTSAPGGTSISITLGSVVNPVTAQVTGDFELTSATATRGYIDTAQPRSAVIGCPTSTTRAPRRGMNVSSGGDAWSYPDGVTSPSWGTDVASIASLSVSDYLVADRFGFTVPPGATITGIAFTVERDNDGWDVVDNAVRVVKASSGLTDRSSTTPWATPWEAVPVIYGGATDLWGDTWSAADVESPTFGVALAARAATPGMPGKVRVGYVTGTLYFSYAGCP